VTDWVTSVIEAAGYLGLALLMALECVFPPIPSEAILPFAGFVVAEGGMSFPLAVAAATAGSLAGNVALYVAARRGGRALVARHGRRVGATPERLERLEAWMDRWGKATVLVARAVPLARSAVSLPAGLARFRFLPFVVLTTIGSAAWNGVLIGLGWALDDAWQGVEERTSGLTVLVLAVAVAAAAVWVVVARRRRSPAGGSSRAS
jgi:membrane protein DedA with SNARE-associated domain